MTPGRLGVAGRELAVDEAQEPLVARGESCQRSSTFTIRVSDRVSDFATAAERNAEGIRDLPVPEALGSQRETSAVPFGQRAEHGEQTVLPLAACQLLLRVRPVDGAAGRGRGRRGPGVVYIRPSVAASRPQPLLEREVVGDPEQPAPEVGSGLPELHVPEQREEHVLHNVLSVVRVDAEGADISQERRAAFVKERQHLGFDVLLTARLDVEDRRKDGVESDFAIASRNLIPVLPPKNA